MASSQETEALRLLTELGFEDLKIIGVYGDVIAYTHTNGDPVLDGPIARIVGPGVRLEPWTARL